MEKRNDAFADLNIVIDELKEWFSAQEIKTDVIEETLSTVTEKLVLLYAVKEYAILLLYIKSLFSKHKLVLPDIFNHVPCNNELMQPFCTVILTNWIEIIGGGYHER